MREELSGSLVVVEGADGMETEVSLDQLQGNLNEELSQCLAIGRAVRDALMRDESDGATVTVRVWFQ